MSAAQGLARRLSAAKSVTASRSCLLAPQRNPTWMTLPDWRVEGATPARQAGGADGARPRQGGEDLRVGVAGELVGDVGVEGVDLSVEAFQYGHECAGGGGGVGSGGAAWGAGEPAVQHRGVGAAAVADAGQPGGQAGDRQPVGAVLAVEAGQNVRLICESRSANKPTAPGNTIIRCARSWLATATRWATRSLRARQVWRKVAVAAVSGSSRCSRARSVRRVSASTNASNRSSLLPAEP